MTLALGSRRKESSTRVLRVRLTPCVSPSKAEGPEEEEDSGDQGFLSSIFFDEVADGGLCGASHVEEVVEDTVCARFDLVMIAMMRDDSRRKV